MTMDDREEDEVDGSSLVEVEIKVEETSDEEFLSCTSSPGNSEGKDPMYFPQFSSENVMEESFRGAYHTDTTLLAPTDLERYETPDPTTISQSEAPILGLHTLLNPAAYFNPSSSPPSSSLSPSSSSSTATTTAAADIFYSTPQLSSISNNHLYAFASCPESNSFNPVLCFNGSSNELTYLSPSNLIQEYPYGISPKSNYDYESSLQVLTSLGTNFCTSFGLTDNQQQHSDTDFSLPTILDNPDDPDQKLDVPCQIKELPSSPPDAHDVVINGEKCLDVNITQNDDGLQDVSSACVKTESDSEIDSEPDEATMTTEESTEVSDADDSQISLISKNLKDQAQEKVESDPSFPINVLQIKEESQVDNLYSFSCAVCPARFPCAEDLDFHTQFHDNRGEGVGAGRNKTVVFNCRKCDESFKSEKSFNLHLERHLNPNYVPRKPRKDKTAKEIVTCIVCGLNCICPSRLRDHMRKHTGEKPYQCHVCGKSFVTQPVLRRHAKEHEQYKPYPCTICNKQFAARANLLGHMRLHDRKRTVLCTTCGKSYRNQTDLRIHERSHTGEKPYQCGVCGKSFVTNVVLRRHERGHAEHKPFPCPVCPKSFAAAVDMRSHMRAHPIKDLPLQCYICAYECVDSTELEDHIDGHGLGKKKRFQCDICGRISRNQSEFDIHHRRHTGERPFTCEICHKSFVTNVILRKHLRSHATVKPYQCEVCPKSFAAMADMKSHMRSHPAKKLQESILKFKFNKRRSFKKISSSLILELLGQYSAMETMTTTTTTTTTTAAAMTEESEARNYRRKPQDEGRDMVRLSCSFCGKQSMSASYIRAHEKSHMTGKIRYCSRCGKMCSSYKTLMKHETRVHQIDHHYNNPPIIDDRTTENSCESGTTEN